MIKICQDFIVEEVEQFERNYRRNMTFIDALRQITGSINQIIGRFGYYKAT